MQKSKKKLLIANWKMNPQSLFEAKKLFNEVKSVASKLSKVETVIAPPYVYLSELSKLYRGHRIAFAGQDVFWEEKGSFTGEVSPRMLKDVGVSYVIIGHSERRALGEDNDTVNKKVLSALGAGLTVALCIGESERDHLGGTHLAFLTEQIESALKGVSQKQLSRVVIAYEPIWAIGRSEADAMRPAELHETVLFIRKIVAGLYEKKVGLKLTILYGGSAEKGNTESLLTEGEVDGLLVGHASLSARDFNEMLIIAQRTA